MTDVHGEFVEYSESLKGVDEKEYTNPMDRPPVPMDRPPVWETVWKNPRGSWRVEQDAPTDFHRIRR